MSLIKDIKDQLETVNSELVWLKKSIETKKYECEDLDICDFSDIESRFEDLESAIEYLESYSNELVDKIEELC